VNTRFVHPGNTVALERGGVDRDHDLHRRAVVVLASRQRAEPIRAIERFR
jgi:hypothetical protein